MLYYLKWCHYNVTSCCLISYGWEIEEQVFAEDRESRFHEKHIIAREEVVPFKVTRYYMQP